MTYKSMTMTDTNEIPSMFQPKKNDRLDMVIEKLKDHIGLVQQTESSDEDMNESEMFKPSENEEATFTSLSITPTEKNSLTKSYLMWQNTANVCWLDASMALLVHNQTLIKSIGESTSSEIASIIQHYHKAISVLNNLSDFEDIYERVEATRDILRTVQDSALKYLQPIVKYKEGVPDSAFCSLFNLIVEDKSIKRLFDLEYSWVQVCQVCNIQRNKKSRKPIITLPRVIGFQPSCPISLYQCPSCKAPDESMTLKFRTLPQCLLFHFESGAGKGELQCSSFEVDGRTYRLTGVMTLQKGKESGFNHFVTFIRDPASDAWLECNDLDEDISSFSVVPPFINLNDVYIMMFEANDANGTVPNSLVSDMEGIVEEMESGSDSIPMIDLEDETETAEAKMKSPETNNPEKRKGLIEMVRSDCENRSCKEDFFKSDLFVNAYGKEYKFGSGGLFNRNIIDKPSGAECIHDTTEVLHDGSMKDGVEVKMSDSVEPLLRSEDKDTSVGEVAQNKCIKESDPNIQDELFPKEKSYGNMQTKSEILIPDITSSQNNYCSFKGNLGSLNEKTPSPKSIHEPGDSEHATLINISTRDKSDFCENSNGATNRLDEKDLLSSAKSQQSEMLDNSLITEMFTSNVQLNNFDHADSEITSCTNISQSVSESKIPEVNVKTTGCSKQPIKKVSNTSQSLKDRKRKVENIKAQQNISATFNENSLQNVIVKKIKMTSEDNNPPENLCLPNELINIPKNPTQMQSPTTKQLNTYRGKAKSTLKSMKTDPNSQEKLTSSYVETANDNFSSLVSFKLIDKKESNQILESKLCKASNYMNPYVRLVDIYKNTSQNSSENKTDKINFNETVKSLKRDIPISNNSSDKTVLIANKKKELGNMNTKHTETVLNDAHGNSFRNQKIMNKQEIRNSPKPLTVKPSKAIATLKNKKLKITNNEGSNIESALQKKGTKSSKRIKRKKNCEDLDEIEDSKLGELLDTNLHGIPDFKKPRKVESAPTKKNKTRRLKTAGKQKTISVIETVMGKSLDFKNNVQSVKKDFVQDNTAKLEKLPQSNGNSHVPDCLCDTTEMCEGLIDVVVDNVLRGVFKLVGINEDDKL